jgi:alkylglycerol monooxygenase
MSFFWAAHVVHHSSEEYNLTTALRQSSGSFFNFIFFLPLAFLGVDPVLFVTVASANLVYQFWVHTRHVGKLGFIEWFMVTPSNHRVHHAQNQIYLDRNYGGVFIVWDRLFGSYQGELDDEKPIYGVRKALKSWNPLYANIQVYKQLMQDSVYTNKWSDKFKVWFGRTGWRPNDVSHKFPLARVDLYQFSAYQTEISLITKIYSVLQYIIISLLALFLLVNASELDASYQLCVAFFVIASSINLAWIMENKLIAIWLESLKLLVAGTLLFNVDLGAYTSAAFVTILVSGILLFRLYFQHKTQFLDNSELNTHKN